MYRNLNLFKYMLAYILTTCRYPDLFIVFKNFSKLSYLIVLCSFLISIIYILKFKYNLRIAN